MLGELPNSFAKRRLGIAPGSPQHDYLNALLRTAYFKGVNSEAAKWEARLTDIFPGSPAGIGPTRSYPKESRHGAGAE